MWHSGRWVDFLFFLWKSVLKIAQASQLYYSSTPPPHPPKPTPAPKNFFGSVKTVQTFLSRAKENKNPEHSSRHQELSSGPRLLPTYYLVKLFLHPLWGGYVPLKGLPCLMHCWKLLQFLWFAAVFFFKTDLANKNERVGTSSKNFLGGGKIPPKNSPFWRGGGGKGTGSKSPYLDYRFLQNWSKIFPKKNSTFLSDLLANLAKSSCGGSPVHLPHEMKN